MTHNFFFFCLFLKKLLTCRIATVCICHDKGVILRLILRVIYGDQVHRGFSITEIVRELHKRVASSSLLGMYENFVLGTFMCTSTLSRDHILMGVGSLMYLRYIFFVVSS